MRFKDEYEFEAAPISTRLAHIYGKPVALDECIAGDPFNCQQCTEVVLNGAACIDIDGDGFCTLSCVEDYIFERFQRIEGKRQKFKVIEGGGQKSEPFPFEFPTYSLETMFNIEEIENAKCYDSN